ncbi:hypothetical protein FG91_00549 [Sphingopyxis sp. LC81]|uniref:nuclear transport factor 2 family protein n=1 Tax=unclassified Sphingopyxis TaxID=2614943 RepID=UPI00050F36FC|nr:MULTISPECIES: nuclear transport factor 2 family protein [unclassified Sphingopyxis]KGB56756.1 hypothetical protein FG91_00549 [Sphingopyxis sp. LC81]MBR2171055.1 nuclear transport factor 2 family protein [Sphingopyxis sp.]
MMTEAVNLAAIEEIRLLKARYVRALDTKDWALLRSLLTDDMVGDFREMPGEADEKLLTTGAEAFVAGVAAALEHATTVHHVHSFEIRFTGARDAEGIWAMDDHFWAGEGSDLAGRSRHGFGHYHDCYRKARGRWLIARTRLSRIRVERD